MLGLRIRDTGALRFDDGTPVRAASGIARFGDGYLVAQDDGTHVAWWRPASTTRLRVLPPIGGLDTFAEEDGTKRWKPDLEAVCSVEADGRAAAILLGSGSLPSRTRVVVVTGPDDTPEVHASDLAALYDRVGAAMDVSPAVRNLEGACLVDGRLRWFQRGDRTNGVPDASVDLDLPALVDAVRSGGDGREVAVLDVHAYDLDRAGLGPVAVTDAVTLVDGRVLVAIAAEDTPDPVADGPVTASGLALLDGTDVVAAASLPPDDHGSVRKVEGLTVTSEGRGRVRLLAVVDQDDVHLASPVLDLELTLPPGLHA